MSPEEKIADVLKSIADERIISSNPDLIEFNFNDHVVGGGIVNGEDERKILLKLNAEGIIKLRIPEDKDAVYRYNYSLEEYLPNSINILIEITNKFNDYLKQYKKYLKIETNKNYWNFVNPFWLLWQIFLLIKKFVIKNKIISFIILVLAIVSALVTLSTSDYSKIGENINNLKSFLIEF